MSKTHSFFIFQSVGISKCWDNTLEGESVGTTLLKI